MKYLNNFLCDLFDFAAALTVLCLVFPLFALLTVCIKMDSRGPVFYTQVRYGMGRKAFRIRKFRSMHCGAETTKPVWGSENDPRATKLGKFLRISHIDELPQLFNILKGEMSLVGPRPERPYFARHFTYAIYGYEERHTVKPGLTGWAQINGLRGNSSVIERTVYDRFYVNNRSLFFNLRIILATPFAKPIKECPPADDLMSEYRHSLTLPQAADGAEENSPLIMPTKKA